MSTATAPDWLTQGHLQESLRDGLKLPNLQLLEYEMSPAVAVGDNYASVMLRSKFLVRRDPITDLEVLPVVIKALPPGTFMSETMQVIDVFKCEIEMLDVIVPKMHKLLHDVNSDYQKPCADIYGWSHFPKSMIIMQDLCADGFRMGNRFVGVDLKHAILVMKSYARFHASSYTLLQRDSTVKESCVGVNKFFGESNEDFMRKFFVSGMNGFKEEAEKWTDFPKSFARKLEEIKENLMDRIFDVYREDYYSLTVVTHGDAWLNNMMFKYDESGEPVQHKFVDLQLSACTSHILDLMQFIFSSIHIDVKVSHLEDLLVEYHNELTHTLKLLKQDVDYSYEKFHDAFYKKLFFGMLMTFLCLPFVIAPPKDALDLDKLLADESSLKGSPIYKSDILKTHVTKLLPLFQKNNLL